MLIMSRCSIQMESGIYPICICTAHMICMGIPWTTTDIALSPMVKQPSSKDLTMEHYPLEQNTS